MNVLNIVDPQKLSKECGVTFIIGNGFDLSLGMKTKYTDVYEGYIQSTSTSKNISRFKRDLSENAIHNYEKWSDFEMGMAAYAKTLESEDEFVECVRDFKSYMVRHLAFENKKMIGLINQAGFKNRVIKELERSTEEFYEGLTQNVINQLKKIMEDGIVVRNYISFNYTMSLDALLSVKSRNCAVSEFPPIHIHGKLDNDVVMGVDTISQLKGTPFLLTRKGKRAFVKTYFNFQYDKSRVENAKKIIENSSIICVYGFSMGETDGMWVELLSEWLLKSPDHHLIVYQLCTTKYNRYNYDEIMDIEDEKKINLMGKLKITNEAILNQIHIPIGSDIFEFDFLRIPPPAIRGVGSLAH